MWCKQPVVLTNKISMYTITAMERDNKRAMRRNALGKLYRLLKVNYALMFLVYFIAFIVQPFRIMGRFGMRREMSVVLGMGFIGISAMWV